MSITPATAQIVCSGNTCVDYSQLVIQPIPEPPEDTDWTACPPPASIENQTVLFPHLFWQAEGKGAGDKAWHQYQALARVTRKTIGRYIKSTPDLGYIDGKPYSGCYQTKEEDFVTRNTSKARAFGFAALVDAAARPPYLRTDDEEIALAWLGEVLQNRRILAAHIALELFKRWELAPCGFEAPAGFQAYERPNSCNTSHNVLGAWSGLFGNDPPAPPVEQYGAYLAYGKLERAKQDVINTTGELAAILVYPVVHAAGMAGMAVGMSSVGASLAAATFPHSFTVASFGALTVTGPAVIVAAAIVIGVMQGISVAKSSQKKGKLEDVLNKQTRERPDVVALLATEKGTQELYGAYLDQTILDPGCSWAGRYCVTGLPAWAPPPPPVAAAPTQLFMTPKGGSSSTQVAHLPYKEWDETGRTAQLVDEWFLVNDGHSVRTYPYIRYLGWEGGKWQASIVGATLRHHFQGASEYHEEGYMNFNTIWGNEMTMSSPSIKPPAPYVNLRHTQQGTGAIRTGTRIDYLTWDGSHWSAQLRDKWFQHTNLGTSARHYDLIISYITWDGKKWMAQLQPDGRTFRHRSETNEERISNILDYKTLDGKNWRLQIE